MRELTFNEVEDVSGGVVITIIAVAAAALVGYGAVAAVDSAQLAANAEIVKDTCGEGNVASVDGDGFTCANGG